MNKLLPFILFGIGGALLPVQTADASSPSRITVDEDVVIYAASANSGGAGVYTLPTSGSFNPTKINGSTYIQYYFQNSGGTFTSKETLYGTSNTNYGVYAAKATAEGNGTDGPWSHTFWSYRDASNTPFTYEIVASDMAYDEISKKIYGWFAADNYNSEYHFCEYDGDNFKVTPIGPNVRTNITALAFDAKGVLWGIEGGSGKLYTINKANGSLTEKGSLGVAASYPGQSAAIDPASGKMYWGAVPNQMSASLYEVDLEACTATKVYDFPMGKRYNAFYIPAPATKKGAPAEITDLSAVFTGNGNDVKVSFTAPSKTFGGSDLSGELTFTVKIDDTVPETDGTGKINAGASFEKTYTMTQGNHTVTVVVGNAVGDAPAASATVYSGFDTPGAVSGLTATADGNNVAISWGAPSGQNGGIVDLSGISYRVVRNPGTVLLAENTGETALADVLPEGHVKEYTYTVTVFSGEQEGISATSEGISYGSPYTIPYSQDFESIGSFAESGLKAIAVNNASQTWKLGEMNGNKCAEVAGIASTKHDYTLFTAPVKLTAGTEYTLRFGLAVSAAYYQTGIRVFLSKEQNMNDENAITPYIAPNLGLSVWNPDDANKLKEYSYQFTVEEDGVYSVGFYDFASDRSGAYSIYLDNIEITGKLPVPEAPTEMAANPIETGSRTIELTFRLPSKDVNGADLETISKAEIICGNEVLGTFESNFDKSAFVPGAYATCRIDEAPRGYKAYKAVVYNGEYASEPSVTAAAFSGHINNIKIVDVKFPAEIPYDGKGEVEVTVMNDGFEQIYVYNVDLVAEGRAVDSAEGVALKSDETHTYNFDIYWDSYEPRTRTYGVAVVYDDDDPTDNASKDFSVKFEKDPVGVDETNADQIMVSADNGVLSISGFSFVEVFSVNGTKVASTHVNGHWTISLPKGVYIVKTESAVHKTTI